MVVNRVLSYYNTTWMLLNDLKKKSKYIPFRPWFGKQQSPSRISAKDVSPKGRQLNNPRVKDWHGVIFFSRPRLSNSWQVSIGKDETRSKWYTHRLSLLMNLVIILSKCVPRSWKNCAWVLRGEQKSKRAAIRDDEEESKEKGGERNKWMK